MTPLERAARALVVELGRQEDGPLSEESMSPDRVCFTEGLSIQYINQGMVDCGALVRAVLLAIREPILSAIHDKADLVSGSDLEGRGFNRGVYASEDAVKAMIDKALEEG